MSDSPAELTPMLASAQFLKELSPSDLEQVVAIASLQTVAEGTVLYQQGDVCGTLHVVAEGLVAVDMCMPRQGCTRILTVGPGELLGWSALLADGTMTARASAVQDTKLIALPAQELRRLCENDHDIGYAVMRQIAVSLARRLLATRLQTLDMFGETRPAATFPSAPGSDPDNPR